MNTDNDFTTDPIAALRVALRNPLPTLIGSTVAIVPVGGYYLGHCQIASWNPLADPLSVLAYSALAFSGSTVYGWGRAMFGAWFKALAFTVLAEGLMMWGGSEALAYVALALLVLINAMTCGCRLALRSAPAPPAAVAPAVAAASRSRPRRTSRPRRAARETPRSAPVALVK